MRTVPTATSAARRARLERRAVENPIGKAVVSAPSRAEDAPALTGT
jgi:hypothetical protein